MACNEAPGWILPGGLERLHEGVPQGDAVLGVAVEPGLGVELGAYLLRIFFSTWTHGLETSISGAK